MLGCIELSELGERTKSEVVYDFRRVLADVIASNHDTFRWGWTTLSVEIARTRLVSARKRKNGCGTGEGYSEC